MMAPRVISLAATPRSDAAPLFPVTALGGTTPSLVAWVPGLMPPGALKPPDDAQPVRDATGRKHRGAVALERQRSDETDPVELGLRLPHHTGPGQRLLDLVPEGGAGRRHEQLDAVGLGEVDLAPVGQRMV